MQNYDKAYELAREIKESEVYQSYVKAKEEAFANDLNKNLYDKYTELTRQVMGAACDGRDAAAISTADGRFVAEYGADKLYVGRAQTDPADERYL